MTKLDILYYSCSIYTHAYMSRDMRFPTMWYVRPSKPQISLRIRAVWSESLLVAWIFYECLATDWTSFGVSKSKGLLHRFVWVYTCQNATLLEITCHGSYLFEANCNEWNENPCPACYLDMSIHERCLCCCVERLLVNRLLCQETHLWPILQPICNVGHRTVVPIWYHDLAEKYVRKQSNQPSRV